MCRQTGPGRAGGEDGGLSPAEALFLWQDRERRHRGPRLSLDITQMCRQGDVEGCIGSIVLDISICFARCCLGLLEK